jgi:hypothetical protein
MKKEFTGIKDEHRFMGEGEEIFDVNEIIKMKPSMNRRKDREKRGKTL